MRFNKEVLLLCVILLSAALGLNASKAVIITGVEVRNEPPWVGPVVTDPEIVPSTNISTQFWCNSSVSDLNGIDDVNYTAAVLWHQATATESSHDNVTNHYTPVLLREVPTSNISKALFFLFSLHPHVNQGVWVCKVNARDLDGLRSSNETTFTIRPIICSNGRWDEGEILTDCGGICPNCLAPASFEMTVNARSFNTSTFSVASITPDRITITSIVPSNLSSSVGTLDSSNIAVSPVNMTIEGLESKSFDVTVQIPLDLNSSATFISSLTFYSGSLFNVTFPLTVHAIVPDYQPEVVEIQLTTPVVLVYNGSTNVWCNATVWDDNGFSDIKSAKIMLWHNETFEYSTDDPVNHYTASSTHFSQSNETDYGTVSALFSISSVAQSGQWYCKVSVTDSGNLTGFLIKPFTIYNFSCSDNIFTPENEQLTDCGKTCPPCLSADDFTISVVAGTESKKDLTLRSYALEPLLIREFSISRFSTYDKKITLNGTTRIEPRTVVIAPRSAGNVEFNVSTPAGAQKELYYGRIDVFTNTTVSARINAVIDVVLRGAGYMNVQINKTCVKEPVFLNVTNEENRAPIEGANVTVYYNNSRVIHYSKTTREGLAEFKPENSGLHTIEVAKEGFYTEMINTTILECYKEGTCFDGMQNCHDNSCELGVDCGGPCPPCSSCFNSVKDNGEEGIDCGGPCSPCHCFNGVKDGDEMSIDCGGSCDVCPNMTFISMLSMRVWPKEVTSGDEFNVSVVNNRDEGISAFVRVSKPDESELFLSTDNNGFLTIKSDVVGEWSLSALKAGYMPASAKVYVRERLTPAVIITRTVSYVVPAAAVGFSLLYLRKRRKRIVFDRVALSKAIEADRLGDYKKIFVVDIFYAEFSEKAGKLKDRMSPVRLTDEQLIKAEEIASRHGIGMDLAESLVLADSLKAKTIFVGGHPGSVGDKYNGVKLVFV